MMEMALQSKSPKWRKVAFSAVAGAVVGVVGMFGFLSVYESGALGDPGVSEIVAAASGLMYVLLAGQIGIGVASPGFGARFLNVEDADDLREQRHMLGYSAAAMAIWGVGLIILALAEPTGVVRPSLALAVALGLFVAGSLLCVPLWRNMDELMRGMSRDCGNLSFYLIVIVGGGWAMLSHLGFAVGPAPLDWLTMFFALPLVASFIAVGRRGMLMPR